MADDSEALKAIRGAVRAGDVEAVQRLLQANQPLWNHMGVFGSWLHQAAGFGAIDVVKRLVEMGADVNVKGGIDGGNPLHLAASHGHLDVVKYLLSQGGVMDVEEPQWNPLFGAIYGGHTAVARFLMESGIDVDVKYSGEQMQEMDALSFARQWGRSDIAALLPQGEGRGTGGYR